MARNTHVYRYVTIHTNGPIRELYGVSGPILLPTLIDEEIVWSLVLRGVTVYEHFKDYYNKRVKLTKNNFYGDNLYPDNPDIDDPSIGENTYVVQVKDDPVDKQYATGNLYVTIFDSTNSLSNNTENDEP